MKCNICLRTLWTENEKLDNGTREKKICYSCDVVWWIHIFYDAPEQPKKDLRPLKERYEAYQWI